MLPPTLPIRRVRLSLGRDAAVAKWQKRRIIATPASLESPPPPKPQPPPNNAAEVKAAVGVKEAPEVNTPDRHPRPLARAHEKRRERVAQEERQRYRDLLQSVWDEDRASRCETCYNTAS